MISALKRKFRERIKKIVDETNRFRGEVSLGPDCYVSGSNLSGTIVSGEGCKFYKCNIDGHVVIGKYSSFWGPNINVSGKVEVGSFCSIARNVSFQEYNHDFQRLTSYYIFKNIFNEPERSENQTKGSIKLGSDVWIGMHSCILSGVKIGNGAIVSANSVVTGDVPAYSIVAGVPAKVIGHRFDKEIIDKLEGIMWWDWSIEKIKNNKAVFEGELSLDKLNSLI